MSSLSVAHVGRGSPDPRRCRPQGPCPSRRFEPARGFRRVPPDALRPCLMPLASMELPSRAFPPRGAAPALAGRCFLAGSSSDHRRRRTSGIVVTAFTDRASSLPRAHREVDPRRRGRDDGSLQPLTRRLWARRERPARPLRSFAPPEGPFGDDPGLGQAGSPVGALLGFSPSRALSTSVLGPVSRRETRVKAKPSREPLQAPDHRGCTPRFGLRPRAREPRIRRSGGL